MKTTPTPKTQLILVGGFLAAGKTTLIAKAAERLVRAGKRVGLITNDQAANLVDTAILQQATDAVQEVAGGCFCCRFDDLMHSMDQMVSGGTPDVLIGEPVGSCTDLSATVIQPMKQFHNDRYHVAPFSVLVDVKQVRTLERLRKSMQGAEATRFPKNVMYIYEKQIEEADLIVLNKADLLSAAEVAQVEATLKQEFTQAPVFTISATQGLGVDRWLDYVLAGDVAGRTITAVDYDEYADGEAALGWLNAAIQLESGEGIDCPVFCRCFLNAMREELRAVPAEVAHLKLHLTADEGTMVANLTSNDGEPSVRGVVQPFPQKATLLVNVRAKIDPQQLRAITEKCIYQIAGAGIRATTKELQSFAPSRPTPTHRFQEIV